MTQPIDTSSGIALGIRHVVAGIHIGSMGHLHPQVLARTGISSVLSVGAQPGIVPDEIRHRHSPLSYQDIDPTELFSAANWVDDQVHTERPVLIRSERGLQRPALVAGIVILNMGGRYMDAINCVRRASPKALTDFRYLDILRTYDDEINVRQMQARATALGTAPIMPKPGWIP